ncbi:transcriptional regulator GutM [Enterococcus sp. RIT-PI-f]|uniref:transcriptional regulator GutM n=1 Tax=Enterococcus sp. RIT-PI-f TaxID=1690244 RepID=UPI0006B8822B|nr:transcriptional regulator GutM [Enterococcus sp. RIT-PI-f]
MNNPLIVVLFFIVLWLVNSLSSIFYLKKVNRRIADNKRKYGKTQGYMGVSVEKVNRIRKVMLIVITNIDGKILECEYLYGFTNLAAFKNRSDLVGKNIDDIQDEKDIFFNAIKTCSMKIREQMN